jgi:hypothetical protein
MYLRKKQRLLPYTALTDWLCITKVERVYCAVRTEILYKTDTFVLKELRDVTVKQDTETRIRNTP